MGKRIIYLEVQCLVDFFKGGSGVDQSYRVTEDPLPEDAKVIGYETMGHWTENLLGVVLESPSWYGDSRDPPLRHPVISITITAPEPAGGG